MYYLELDVASWQDFEVFAQQLGGQRLSDAMWMFQLQGTAPDRSQKVFASRDLMPPDFEFLRLSSPVGLIADIGPGASLRRLGQLQIGGISFSPGATNGHPDDGLVNIGTVIPLAALSLQQPAILFVYFSVLARAADTMEQELRPGKGPDIF